MNRSLPWKPSAWLIALDLAGCVLLGLGLHVQYAPGATRLAMALAPLRLPLLVLGGLLLVAGSVVAVVSVLRHRSSS